MQPFRNQESWREVALDRVGCCAQKLPFRFDSTGQKLFSNSKQQDKMMSIMCFRYITARSFVGNELSLLNSPLRVKAGEFVELNT